MTDERQAGLRHAIACEFTYTGPHDYRTARAIVDETFARHADPSQDALAVAQVSAEEELDVDVLTDALGGMGVIDSGTWVSFNRADAERIAELYALHARLAATPSAQDETP